MKLKNDKGITLATLTITIIMMVIVAGIVIYYGSNAIKQAKVQDVRTNMLLIQAEIKEYVEQAKFEGKDTIDGVVKDGVALSIYESPQTDYYVIRNIEEIGLHELYSEDYYIAYDIDSTMVDVYYIPGVKDSSGYTYHTLSEINAIFE